MNNPAPVQTGNCAICNLAFVQTNIPSPNNVGFNCFVYGDVGDGSFRKVCVECFMKTIKDHEVVKQNFELQKNELTYNYAIQISQMEEEITECHKTILSLKELSCALNSTLFDIEDKKIIKEEQKSSDATLIEVQELRKKEEDWAKENEELKRSLEKEKELVKQLNLYIQELKLQNESQALQLQQERSEPKNKQGINIKEIEEKNVSLLIDNLSSKIEGRLKDEPYLKEIFEKSKFAFEQYKKQIIEAFEKEEEGQMKKSEICQDMIKKFKENMDDEETEGVIGPLEKKVDAAIKNGSKIRNFLDEFLSEKEK